MFAGVTPEHRHWVAAFLDGEGSIIRRDRPGRRPTFVIVFANNHLPLLEHARELCGSGRIYSSKRAYQLRIERVGDVHRILKEVEPVLILKREKAQMALETLRRYVAIAA